MKIPEPRRLSNGRYYIYLRLNGKGISVTEDTKAACIARARSIKAQYKAGELDVKPKQEPEKKKNTAPTLGAVLDAYIEKYEPVLSPSTIRGYNVVRRNRFSDCMNKAVDEIDWQEMINTETGRVGAKTVKNAWGLVASSMKDKGLNVPSVKLASVPVKEIPFLQPEEIAPFLKEMEGDLAELPALLMLHGLRFSEVLGLTWDNVDLQANTIRVQGAVVLDKGNKLTRKDTNKNATSTRTVPIIIPRLAVILKSVEKKKGPVTTLFNTTVYHHVQAACERANITVVGNHGLRHSFASLAYHLGLSERQIMELGGWSNPATMHKIYVRISNSDRTTAAEKMRAFFQNANQNAN